MLEKPTALAIMQQRIIISRFPILIHTERRRGGPWGIPNGINAPAPSMDYSRFHRKLGEEKFSLKLVRVVNAIL